jgi:hypothetical protein
MDSSSFLGTPCIKKVSKYEKKLQLMSYNMMIGYDIYDRFTMEHFPLRQSMILTTSFFFACDSIQGVSAKTFEPNISVICQRIFMKFKMQIF